MEKIKNYTEFKFKALDILEEQNQIISKDDMRFAYIIHINCKFSIKEALEYTLSNYFPSNINFKKN